MKAINDHIYAITVTFQELGKGKFWLYLIPSLAIGLIFWIISEFIGSIFSFLNYAEEFPVVGSWLGTGVSVTKGFFSYVGDLFYQFVILTVLSPVYCLLSEKVDNTVTGAKFNGGFTRIVTDFIRMIFIVIISLILYIVAFLVWWTLSWILGLGVLDQFMNLFIGAFFLGFSFYDYSLERYNIGTWKSWMFSFEKMGYMLLTGIIFNFSFQIPFFGVILSPFLTTIISTVVFLKMHQKIPQHSNQ